MVATNRNAGKKESPFKRALHNAVLRAKRMTHKAGGE